MDPSTRKSRYNTAELNDILDTLTIRHAHLEGQHGPLLKQDSDRRPLSAEAFGFQQHSADASVRKANQHDQISRLAGAIALYALAQGDKSDAAEMQDVALAHRELCERGEVKISARELLAAGAKAEQGHGLDFNQYEANGEAFAVEGSEPFVAPPRLSAEETSQKWLDAVSSVGDLDLLAQGGRQTEQDKLFPPASVAAVEAQLAANPTNDRSPTERGY